MSQDLFRVIWSMIIIMYHDLHKCHQSPVRSDVGGCCLEACQYCIRHMNRHHMRIDRLRLCLSQPALLPRLKQLGFTGVGLIISEAMFILETFQVEHTRISEDKLQFVFYIIDIFIWWYHHQYIYHIYDIYEESEWTSSQDLSAEELSGEDVGGRVTWVPTAAHANSAVLVATSPSRDRTDVFRVHWSIKMFSEEFCWWFTRWVFIQVM